MLDHPCMQIADKRSDVLLAGSTPLLHLVAVDGPLEGEDRIDAADRLDRERSDDGRGLAPLLQLRGGIGELEELPAGVGPAQRAAERHRLPVRAEQVVVAGIGIGLQHSARPGAQMFDGMLAAPIARIMVDRGRRSSASEWPVIAHIGPQSADIGLVPSEHQDGGIVAVQSLCGKDMGLDQPVKRHQRRAAGPDLVGERGEAELDAFAGIAVTLAVERLVRAELLEQDHREEARPEHPARSNVERRGRLRDLLAVPARELLPHGLDHLPLARDHFQRLGHVLAELRQAAAAAGRT